MAFDVSSLSKFKNTKSVKDSHQIMAKCYSYVASAYLLTDNIRIALRVYLDYIFRIRNSHILKDDRFQKMVEDLLCKCTGKNETDITKYDVKNNEGRILYYIKNAINNKYISAFIFKNMKENKCKDIVIPPTLTTVNDIENYFKDLEI